MSKTWLRLRRLLGWMVLYFVHLFPLSGILFPFIPPGVWLGDLARRKSRFLWHFLRAAYYALALLVTIDFYRMTSFLDPYDWAAIVGASAAGYTIARFRSRYRSLLFGLPLAFAVPLAVLPPIQPSLVTRALILTCGALFFVLLVALVGRAAARRPSPFAWAWAILVPSFLLRTFLFWLLPEAGADKIVGAIPGAHIFFRAPPTPRFTELHIPVNLNDMRLAIEGCDEGSRIVGTLGSLTFGREEDPSGWREIRLQPGDEMALDCEKRIAYVAEFLWHEVLEIPLDTLEMRRPFRECHDQMGGGPTILAWNEEKTVLYGFDNGSTLDRFDPVTHTCRTVVSGSNIMGFSADESRDEVLVARNARLDVCDISRSHQCETKVRLSDPELPAWLQTDRMNDPLFVVHYHKIARDPIRGSVFVTSGHSGILYRIDRETMKLTGTVYLEPGIRWVVSDPERGRVFVGGFVRGGLFVVDAQTMEVLGEAYMGRKIRYLAMDRRGRLLLASSAGAIEIDVDQFLQAKRAKRTAG